MVAGDPLGRGGLQCEASKGSNFMNEPQILVLGGASMLVAGLCVLRVPEPAVHAA